MSDMLVMHAVRNAVDALLENHPSVISNEQARLLEDVGRAGGEAIAKQLGMRAHVSAWYEFDEQGEPALRVGAEDPARNGRVVEVMVKAETF